MTRVAKRAPKGPEIGGKFISKPLVLKKSEIEKRKEASEGPQQNRYRSNDRVADWPKRQRSETTQGIRSEQRRVNRLSEKEKRSTCYLCRRDGHRVKNCPQASNHDVGVCYHCGSEDHTTKSCPKPGKSFPYATCYVCKERGHLASKCKLNDKGLYPNGGGCKYCGSKLHLMRDCKPAQNNVAGTTVGMVVPSQGGDDDDVFTALHMQQKDKSKAASVQRRQASAPKVKKVVVNF